MAPRRNCNASHQGKINVQGRQRCQYVPQCRKEKFTRHVCGTGDRFRASSRTSPDCALQTADDRFRDEPSGLLLPSHTGCAEPPAESHRWRRASRTTRRCTLQALRRRAAQGRHPGVESTGPKRTLRVWKVETCDCRNSAARPGDSLLSRVPDGTHKTSFASLKNWPLSGRLSGPTASRSPAIQLKSADQHLTRQNHRF